MIDPWTLGELAGFEARAVLALGGFELGATWAAIRPIGRRPRACMLRSADE